MTREEEDRELRRWLPLVRATLSRMRLPRRVTPDDLLTDGLLGCLEALRTHDPARGTLEGRVGALVRARALDGLRRLDPLTRGHRLAVNRGLVSRPRRVPLWSLRHAPSPLAALADRDEADRLLVRLPARWRLACRMVYLEGFRQKDAALATGLTPSGVSQAIAAALARLRAGPACHQSPIPGSIQA